MLNPTQLRRLDELIRYKNRYQINIQFWPDQTAVYIYKDHVELASFGGDFEDAIPPAVRYLDRINQKGNK